MVLRAAALLLAVSATVAADRPSGHSSAAADPAPCAGVFFVHFLADQKIRFALSRDGFHFTPLLNNSAVPDLDGDGNSSIRDPFLRFDAASGLYRMCDSPGALTPAAVGPLALCPAAACCPESCCPEPAVLEAAALSLPSCWPGWRRTATSLATTR